MEKDKISYYRDILINPVKECALYKPRFGHSKKNGYSLADFQSLYRGDAFYSWLGLDNDLMYSAHKAAGGITSIYRQIGIGCERLVRSVFMDYLGLSKTDVVWSYKVKGSGNRECTLYLDARIIFNKIENEKVKNKFYSWMSGIAENLAITSSIQDAIKGIVFEVRQGYKSKDSKRQNADISNAANAYANGYVPCLMLMSAQIDDDIVSRYYMAKWAILQGTFEESPLLSTFSFFDKIIGFDFLEFMDSNKEYFRGVVRQVLIKLMDVE